MYPLLGLTTFHLSTQTLAADSPSVDPLCGQGPQRRGPRVAKTGLQAEVADLLYSLGGRMYWGPRPAFFGWPRPLGGSQRTQIRHLGILNLSGYLPDWVTHKAPRDVFTAISQVFKLWRGGGGGVGGTIYTISPFHPHHSSMRWNL